MDFLSNIELGLQTAATPANLLYCAFGVFLGNLVGVLPGVGALAAISMLFPMTFYLDPAAALIMLAGIWYGTAYGGSIASILLNIPGGASTAVTCLDGYPMALQGRGGVALLMTTLASFIGGAIGMTILVLFTPVIAAFAMHFGSADYFSVILFGLVAASTISSGSAIKGLAMVVLGIMCGTVGMDIYVGSPRFSFGFLELTDHVSLVALAMGIFGVAEVIASVGKVEVGGIRRDSVRLRAMIPTRAELRRSWAPALRGSFIGAFFGTLPGTGPSVASFLSYAFEKRIAKDPTIFGRGAIEGVVSPEAANNAAEPTAFIATLGLGIPGSATMALMLGALMIHGIAPGPTLITHHPDVFWGLVMSFWIGNILLLILNVPLVGIWVRLLMVPYYLLYPAIVAFICIGTYSTNNSTFDVWLVALFGLLGYLMRVMEFPAAPLLLGFVLGPMMEEQFRRSMLLSSGSFEIFIDRPISACFMVLTLSSLVWGLVAALRQRSVMAVPALENPNDVDTTSQAGR